MLYNETNNFDEIKTLLPHKTEIEVVIRPCLDIVYQGQTTESLVDSF